MASLCSREIKSINISLRVHMVPNPRPKRYQCPVEGCGKAYTRPSLLNQHERTHNNERPFACPEEGCDKSFYRKSHLQVHAHSHQSNSEKPFQCRICGKGATSTQLLRRHELTHTKKYKCQYDGCKEAYYRFQSLKHHVDTLHKQVLTCDICNRKYQRPLKLSEHRLKYHGDVLTHPCKHPGCFSSFKDATALQKHTKSDHPPLKCPTCGVTCVAEKALAAHMLVHDNSKVVSLWKCEFCDVKVVSRFDLIRHYNDIHDKIPDDMLDATEKDHLELFLLEADGSSLQTLLRDPEFKPDFGPEEDIEPETALDLGNAKDLSASLADGKTSIIDLVLGNFIKSFLCPKKSCGRKFERQHAYEKHIKWHEAQLQIVDDYLRKLEGEEENNKENGEEELDHFSDLSGAADQSNEELEDESDIDETGIIDSSDEEYDSAPKRPKLEENSDVEDPEMEEKQKELDALLSMELAGLDD